MFGTVQVNYILTTPNQWEWWDMLNWIDEYYAPQYDCANSPNSAIVAG